MKKAGDILKALFEDRFGPQFTEKARSTAGLFSAWAEITAAAWPPSGEREKNDVPPAAAHSRIREFEKGILLVEADHPGMIQLLQIKQQELLSIARRRFPAMEIRGISFCLSRDPFSFSKPGGVNVSPVENAPSKQTAIPAAVIRDGGQAEISKKAFGNKNDTYYDALKKLGESVKKNEKSPG